MTRKMGELSTVTHRFAESAAPATPATGFGVIYQKTDGKFYTKDDAGNEAIASYRPLGADSWGNSPKSDINFLGQDSSDGSYWEVDGYEMRRWEVREITDASSFDSRSRYCINFNSATDRTLTIVDASIAIGHEILATAIQVSGGTGHKILLPTGVFFGSGTDRAAILNATTSRLWAVAITETRFEIFISTDVTFAAS